MDVSGLTLEEVYHEYGPEGENLTVRVTDDIKCRYVRGAHEVRTLPLSLSISICLGEWM